MDSNLCWLPTLNKHSLTSCVAIDLVISFSLQLLCHFCDNWKVPHSADCSKDYETPPPFLFAKCIHKNNEYIIWISLWKNEAATSFIEFKCLMFKWENRKINNPFRLTHEPNPSLQVLNIPNKTEITPLQGTWAGKLKRHHISNFSLEPSFKPPIITTGRHTSRSAARIDLQIKAGKSQKSSSLVSKHDYLGLEIGEKEVNN